MCISGNDPGIRLPAHRSEQYKHGDAGRYEAVYDFAQVKLSARKLFPGDHGNPSSLSLMVVKVTAIVWLGC